MSLTANTIEDELILTPNSFEALGLRVARLPANRFLDFFDQVRDNRPLRSTLIALREANEAFEHTNNAIDKVNAMEIQIVAARAQLMASRRKISHALHEFTEVLRRDALGAQIPRSWYALLNPEPPREQPLYPEPPREEESTTADDAPAPIQPLTPPPYHCRSRSPRSTTTTPPRSNRSSTRTRSASPVPRPLAQRITSPAPVLGYVGSYKNFLLLQESKYGRDEDGEVITYDEYAGPSLDVATDDVDHEEANVELQE